MSDTPSQNSPETVRPAFVSRSVLVTGGNRGILWRVLLHKVAYNNIYIYRYMYHNMYLIIYQI